MADKKQNALQKLPVILLLATLCCALWGSAIPGIKTGYELFEIDLTSSGSKLLFAGMRFIIAGIMVIIIGSFLEKRPLIPKKTDWVPILIVSCFQTFLQYLAYYIGLSYTTGITAALISGTNTFFSILIAALIFRSEKLTARKIIGCVIGFGGVVVAQVSGTSVFAFTFRGEGLVLFSAISAAVAAAIIGRCSRGRSAILVSGWQFFIGGVVLFVIGLCLGGKLGAVNLPAIAILLYLGLVSAVAYTLWGCMLKYNPVSRVTIFGFLVPIFGVALSALFLNELSLINLRTVIALVLVCAGIYIVNAKSRKDGLLK